MSKLKEFLEQLEDYELANFYKYRYDSFMPSSMEMIDTEIGNRKMDLSNDTLYQPDKIIEKNSQNYCPRCLSSKFYLANELESTTFKYSTIEYTMDYKTCLVCLFSEEKNKHKKIKSKPLRFLKFWINEKRNK